MEKEGIVYFAIDGEYLKIGYTTDSHARASKRNTDNPRQVCVLHEMPGTRRDEGELHKRFAHLRGRGEWFLYEGELVEFLRELMLPEKRKMARLIAERQLAMKPEVFAELTEWGEALRKANPHIHDPDGDWWRGLLAEARAEILAERNSVS